MKTVLLSKKIVAGVLAGILAMMPMTPFGKLARDRILAVKNAAVDDTVVVTAEQVEEQFEKDKAVLKQYLPGIVCWGDSLTAGAGGNGKNYPNILQEMIEDNILAKYDLKAKMNASEKSDVVWDKYYLPGVYVSNLGVGGERSDTIVGRADVIPMTVQAFTIPEDREKTPIVFNAAENQEIAPILQGDREFNPVTIAGVKGRISVETSEDGTEHHYFFSRGGVGETMEIEDGTPVVTAANEKYRDNIQIIMMGGNGGFNTLDELFAQYDALLARQSSNGERYIIVGYHGRLGALAQYENIDELFEERYGEHYVRTIDYLLGDALADNGMEATEQDKEDIANGVCPSSFLVDGVHFNATGYSIIAKLIYDRMDSLGYFNEVKEICSIQ